MDVKDFINRLDMCCKAQGLKRTQFARDFGIPESTIRNWLRNGNFPNGTETEIDDTDFMLLLKIKKLSAEQKKMLAVVADSLINQKE